MRTPISRTCSTARSARSPRRYAVARARLIPRGPWSADRSDEDEGTLGYLLLDGLLTREVRLGTRTATELLGAGDLLRPWPDGDAHAGEHVTWWVHEELWLAVLDRRVMAVAARWPAPERRALPPALPAHARAEPSAWP